MRLVMVFSGVLLLAACGENEFRCPNNSDYFWPDCPIERGGDREGRMNYEAPKPSRTNAVDTKVSTPDRETEEREGEFSEESETQDRDHPPVMQGHPDKTPAPKKECKHGKVS